MTWSTAATDQQRGMLAGVAAATCIAGIAVAVRSLGADFPTTEVVFLRGLVATAAIGVLAPRAATLSIRSSTRLVWTRSVLTTGAMLAQIAVFQAEGAAIGVASVIAGPVIVVVLESAVAGRIPLRRDMSAVILIVLAGGAYLLARPPSASSFGLVAILASALLSSLGQLTLSQVSKTHDPRSIVLSLSVAMTVLPLAGASAWAFPEGREWLVLGGVAAAGMAGQLMVAVSFRMVSAAHASVVGLLSLPFAALGEMLVRGRVFAVLEIGAMALVAAASLVVAGARSTSRPSPSAIERLGSAAPPPR